MKLGKFSYTSKTKFFSRLMGLSSLLAVIFMLITVSCQPLPGQKTYIGPPSEAELFKAKCGKCHDPELAMKEYRSADIWFATITRMRKEHQADISGKDAKVLVNYHVKRQKHEAAVFNKKCQKCHPGKVFLEQSLSPDQARAIIKRMQQKAGNNIEDNDVEIIVRYHIQSHQAALEENLKGIFRNARGGRSAERRKSGGTPGDVTLFVEKCSSCHEPDRALTVFKDPEVWAQTIKRMQHYSKGEIADQEVNELVDFHVAEQRQEINTFEETCTRCHDDERVNSRSMSEEQWLATIRRMQQKAPDLISDEKIILLAAYFHRRELTMARIFYGKCQLCHDEGSWDTSSQSGTTGQMNGLIVLANEELGESLQIKDVNALRANHVQRQARNMQLFGQDCTTCHIDGIPDKKEKSAEENLSKRSRAEWISFIATLQGLELNKDIQNTVNSQIDYHVSRH